MGDAKCCIRLSVDMAREDAIEFEPTSERARERVPVTVPPERGSPALTPLPKRKRLGEGAREREMV